MSKVMGPTMEVRICEEGAPGTSLKISSVSTHSSTQKLYIALESGKVGCPSLLIRRSSCLIRTLSKETRPSAMRTR